MEKHTKVRKKINLRGIAWNPRTNKYTDEEGNSYDRYEQYRTMKWKCDKCEKTFSTFPKLKLHKNETHSY
jgi:hypothetical protein